MRNRKINISPITYQKINYSSECLNNIFVDGLVLYRYACVMKRRSGSILSISRTPCKTLKYFFIFVNDKANYKKLYVGEFVLHTYKFDKVRIAH